MSRATAARPGDPYTVDELLAVCIARQVSNGELLAHGLATPLVAAGYILAKRTHAPDAVFASAIGQGLVQDWAPLGLTTAETLWLGQAMAHTSFVSIAADLLHTYAPKEFFRPAQVDAAGNTNNLAIGRDHTRPRLRLPGSGGVPDVSVFSERIYLYIPRHSRAIFVPRVDWVSGLGHDPARRRGHGPRYLVSDLGQFDWVEGRMRLATLHPGVTIEQAQARTGFALAVAPDLRETPPPTDEDLRLLREEIDPLGVRRLETLAGAARRAHLRDILSKEQP